MSHSPLKAVVNLILKPAQEVFAYHLPEDFKSLWGMEARRDFVVIVWNETQSDPAISPIRCENVLSPVDWAIAYGAKQARWPKVLILDLQPDFNGSSPIYRRFLEMRPDLFPWLHVLAPPEISLQAILALAKNGVPKLEQRHVDAQVSLLRDARLTLTEGGPKAEADRHAIANIIAPMILRGGKAKDSLHPAALRSLLLATGLIPSQPSGNDGRSPTHTPAGASTADPNQALSTTETGAGLHILLLDDQAKQGWADWVQDCLPEATVSPVTNPNVLMPEVAKQLDAAGTRDLRFRLKLPGMDGSKNPVLLLDLRLFSGMPAEELEFYNSLLPQIQRFKDRDDLAWPAFSSTDPQLTAAIRAISEKKLQLESPEHHEALTWLPRILALADMSLPIVLFSSTGRRMLLKRLAGYGNIITAFEKPTLGDTEAAQRPLDVALGFRDQITLARRWIQPRAWLSLACNPATIKKPGQQAGQSYKAVVYLDETGSFPNLTFVSLVALYMPSQSEEACENILTSKFGESIRHADGKNWTRQNVVQVLNEVSQIPNGPKLALVRLVGNRATFFHTSAEVSDELHDESVGDNLWRQMFRQTVEASLYVVARSLLSPGDRIETFSVRAPTRVRPPKNITEENAIRKRWGVTCEFVGLNARLFEAILELEHQYKSNPNFAGQLPPTINIPQLLKILRPQPPDRMLRYFSEDSPRPIVEEIMKLYRDSSLCPTADLVRAFPINNFESADALEIPVLHFLTDALQGHVALPANIPLFLGNYGIIMEALLEFNRSTLAGDRIAALQSVARVVAHRFSQSLYAPVWNEVGQAVDALRGTEYEEVAEIGLPPSKRRSARGRTLKGTVQNAPSQAPQLRFIDATDGTRYFAPGCIVPLGATVTFTLARNTIPGTEPVAINVQLEPPTPPQLRQAHESAPSRE